MKNYYFLICVIFISQFLSFSQIYSQTYFTDNFESGFSKWIATPNNWDTLSTTYCSYNHCITDSRIGNYTYNTDPTITMLQTINLTNSTFPVLTFYHKYSLQANNTNDSIIVEISTDGGFTWIKKNWWMYTNNAWTYAMINLSNYKYNLFKIRFHLSSHNAWGYTDDGWYIDDVNIREMSELNTPVNLPFSDNFESGKGKWIFGGFNWDTLSSTHVSGQYCITDSRIGNYIFNADPTITLKGKLNLSNTNLPVLTFWQKYSLQSNNTNDSAIIEISTNNGWNWSKLQSWMQTNNTWTFQQINLSSYKYDNFVIRFRLSIHNAWGYTSDGWYLDDINIYDMSSSVRNINNNIPDKFSLIQNYPNPFNPSTKIKFDIAKFCNVKVVVFDVTGKEVVTLVNESLQPGIYETTFDGNLLSSGIYFYRITANDFVSVKRMLLVK